MCKQSLFYSKIVRRKSPKVNFVTEVQKKDKFSVFHSTSNTLLYNNKNISPNLFLNSFKLLLRTSSDHCLQTNKEKTRRPIPNNPEIKK